MSFSIDLNKALGNIKNQSKKVVRGTVFQVYSNVIKLTPVGNPAIWKNPPPPGYVGGTLRNSWFASIGSPDLAGKRGPNQSGLDSINSIVKTINDYDIGDVLYLTNNQPYAYPVEFGLSTQAPEGMVRVAISNAEAALNAQSLQ